MTLRLALLATVMLALPVAAGAQPVTGLYVGAGGGVNWWEASKTGSVRIEAENVGGVGLGSIGWGFGNGLRAEIEGNYRANQIEGMFRPGRIGSSGDARNYGVMVNALYDFDLSGLGIRPSLFMPYLGVGVGHVWTEISNARLAVGSSRYRIDDTDGNFAYQGILGAAWGLGGSVPGLSITSEVRYLGTLEPSLGITHVSGRVRADVPASLKLSNNNFSVLLGIRYAFNAPRPAPIATEPPPAAPPPSVARTYLVFFDWDRADLTDRAQQIIAEAANGARRVQSTRVEVAGHADRSGTPQYNQRLSQRRAETVAAELVHQGISRNEIVVTAFGESRPLVPTADGVHEPQNRRVEIVLR